MTHQDEHDPFEQGLALFNAGKFFECHEVWEIAWKEARGEPRAFFQGLIQAAVAILHAERGNRRGSISVYNKAKAGLDPLASAFMGVALDEFRVALAEFFEQLEAGTEIPGRPRLRRCD
jgi:uncharacterized protein